MKLILLFRKEPCIFIHEIAVICSHWAGSTQRVSQFHKSGTLFQFWLFWGLGVRVDLTKMTLNVFLLQHFLNSNCSNCQRGDLFLLGTKVTTSTKTGFPVITNESENHAYNMSKAWAYGCFSTKMYKAMLWFGYYVLSKMPLETKNLLSFSFNDAMTKQK